MDRDGHMVRVEYRLSDEVFAQAAEDLVPIDAQVDDRGGDAMGGQFADEFDTPFDPEAILPVCALTVGRVAEQLHAGDPGQLAPVAGGDRPPPGQARAKRLQVAQPD